MATTKLRALSELIENTVNFIEQKGVSNNVTLPDLDAPFSLEADSPLMDPEISGRISLVVSAAAHISALLKPAPMSLFTASTQFHISSALRLVVDTNVVEILREAGPQGLHVNDISAHNGVDANKLGRILRLLSSEHIFKEVEPNRFANNRMSSALDTGKNVRELHEKPKDKFVGTAGVAAIVSHFTDDQFKSSAYLQEALTDPSFAKYDDATHTAFNKAFETDLPMFDWYERPGNEDRLRRFGIAFESSSRLFPPNAILDGYSWKSLPPDSVVVDVGGGVGTQTMVIAQEVPHVKCIVQDREAVIAHGIKYFNSNAPELLASQRVSLQAHDFFSPQPVKNARVYFLRLVLHDWPDVACLQILQHIRSAAGPQTELIIIESLMEHACTAPAMNQNIPGIVGNVAPEPLLPNYGRANLFPYLCDMMMISCINGTERTPGHFKSLLERAGWKLKIIHRALAGQHKIVACVA